MFTTYSCVTRRLLPITLLPKWGWGGGGYALWAESGISLRVKRDKANKLLAITLLHKWRGGTLGRERNFAKGKMDKANKLVTLLHKRRWGTLGIKWYFAKGRKDKANNLLAIKNTVHCYTSGGGYSGW